MMMSASQFNIAEREFGFGFGSGSPSHNIPSGSSLADLGTISYSSSYNSNSNSNSNSTERLDHTSSTISTLTTNAMDFVAANQEESEIRHRRVLQETRFLRKFVKILGVACVLLVVCVFGVDVHLLEEVATVLVHNVVAALILILGLNVAALVYDAMATPVPGSPSCPSSRLQGIVRRPSQNVLMPFRHLNLSSRRRRPAEITVRATSSSSSSPRKRSSGGGLFGGLWPRKRSSKNNKEQRESQREPKRRGSADRIKEKFSKKLPMGGRRRGWPSGGRSTAGSI